MRIGEDVALRYITRDGRVGHTWAARLIEETPHRLALYMPVGTPHKRWRRTASGPALLDARWDARTVRFLYPGRAHSIWVSWRADGSFSSYYVNLEEPFRRTSIGFDTNDHHLDIVVERDLSWTYKDEHDLALRASEGSYSPELVAAIRAEAESVVSVIESRGSPFDEGWDAWRPDPSWPLPRLDPRWDVVPPERWERWRWAYPRGDDPAASESG